ncbi:HemK/PrmC family methyltransferase [Paenibacillus sp. CF384]|uniref:N5-glutamine methyltransferase family protein n=1 Tax=Paenibacillus sp. CF384 TaxID=1884382 RepID=UPI00089427ED|nr:HemK/PrmC family methyltransferase [Paenibacillus sp. CF384]SDX26147.1 release factor glutamine methyltransferase [Paenibacillus sp. CF384]
MVENGQAGGVSGSGVHLTIGEVCVRATKMLEARGVSEPRNNAELLLLHVLGIERAALIRDWRDPFPQQHAAEWEALLTRKAAGEPVQYLIGEQWFYGLPYLVTPAVLIPRPETELLVEAVLEAADKLWPEAVGDGVVGSEGVVQSGSAPVSEGSEVSGEAVSEGREVSGEAVSEGREMSGAAESEGVEMSAAAVNEGVAASRASVFKGPTVVDVGTGSGAIGVTLAALRPQWRVCASDLSPDALDVARTNAARHGAAARMTFLQGDLLGPFAQPRSEELAVDVPGSVAGLRIDVLVSNPPYIPAGDIAGLQPEVRDHEPRLALDGGDDGLTPYRRMAEQLLQLSSMPRIVGFELGMGQAEAVADLLRGIGAWREVRIIDDYAGIGRHVLAVE